MDAETIKWLIALPGAILATISIPLVIRKQLLECNKLQLEIWEKEECLRKAHDINISKRRTQNYITVLRWYNRHGWIAVTPIGILVLLTSVFTQSWILFYIACAIVMTLGLLGAYAGDVCSRLSLQQICDDLENLQKNIRK